MPMMEFDVETTSLQWYGANQEMFLTQFLTPSGDPHLFPAASANRDMVQQFLNSATDFRAWNTKFDLHWLKAAGYTLPPESTWHDGMVMAHLVDERRPAALKIRGELMFGKSERDDEAQVKGWLAAEAKRRRAESKEDGSAFIHPNYSDVPNDIMHPYAQQDVVLQRKICDQLELALRQNSELSDLYELERKVLAALFWMEDRGVPFDMEAAESQEGALQIEHDRLEAKCIKLSGRKDFNPRSPVQVSDALDALKADVRFATRTAQGQLKTDEENLSAIDHPLAEAILEYRGVQKMYGNIRSLLWGPDSGAKAQLFPEPYVGPDGRIHPNFRQVGARTGRMSCSDPNMQNWHRDDLRMRYLVEARPGYKLVTADLDSIEMAVFAAYCGDGSLLRSIKAGEDPHSLAAARAGLGERRRSTGATESARQRGKTLNYSIIYGAGVRSLRKAFGVSQDEAQSILRRYHRAFPEVGALQSNIEYALDQKGYVKSAWGRRFRGERQAYQEAYKFTNYIVQGTAADLLKEATAACHKQGIPLIMCVHDELVAEVPEEDAEEAGRIIEKALTDHPRLTEKVPLAAEATIVDRWSDAKTPGYKPPHTKGDE